MPITIKSTELKYKNPSTGQYQGIDAVAERTTSEQCALIEAKGAETIASIPSDYTTLSDTVDDLTSDVSDLNGAIDAIGTLPIAVAKGGTGANNVRDAQINLSTLSVYPLNRNKTLTVDISEYNACMFVYFGKYGDVPLFKMFGANAFEPVYQSFDTSTTNLTVTSSNGILSVHAPNYTDGVAIQVFPFTRKFTINVS